MSKIINSNIIVILFALVILVTEVTVFFTIKSNYSKAQQQREKQIETVKVVLRESYSQKCLLLIPNTERTQANVDRCNTQAAEQVKKEYDK